jgi:very-short-patch-repair endonuclease
MNRMRFALEQLPPKMREQAQRKLAGQQSTRVREHVCKDEPETVATAIAKRRPKMKLLSKAEERLAFHMRAEGIAFEREYRFDQTRRWRFDFAFPEKRLAIEIDGGIHTGGRHVRARGFCDDLAKLNSAVMQGWKVLRFVPSWVKNGLAINTIKKALACA